MCMHVCMYIVIQELPLYIEDDELNCCYNKLMKQKTRKEIYGKV